MNQKKAKYLRNKAKSLTIGRPDVVYDPLRPSGLFLGQLTLLPTCTRAVYQRLKKTS